MNSRRRGRSALPLSLFALAVVAACGGAVDNSELFKKNAGTTGTSGGTPTATATATTNPPTAPTPSPVPQPMPPAATCDVSFSTDVMQVFAQTGCAANGCHSGNVNAPAMDLTSPSLTYKSLTGFKASNGQPYVSVGSTNPKASAISCNLRHQCGVGMPLGDKVGANQLQVIDTWLACGAPFN